MENNENTPAGVVSRGNASAWVHLIWALAFVAVFAISAVWVLPLFMAQKLANTGIDAVKQALKADVNVNSIVSQMLGQISRQKKLVVLTQNVSVELTREADRRVFNDWVPAGSAWLKLKVLDNQVQFYVPLDQIDISRIRFDAATGILQIFAPPVKIDQEMVFVQNDPTRILAEEKGSWVPWFGPKVADLKKEAMADLKNEILKTANNELVWAEARREAQTALEDFFRLLQNSLRDNVRLQIYMP